MVKPKVAPLLQFTRRRCQKKLDIYAAQQLDAHSRTCAGTSEQMSPGQHAARPRPRECSITACPPLNPLLKGNLNSFLKNEEAFQFVAKYRLPPCEVASFGAIYNKDEPPGPGRRPAGGDCWWSAFLLCTGSKVNTSILRSATAWQAAKGLTVQSHTAAVCCLPQPTQRWLRLVTEASAGVEGP